MVGIIDISSNSFTGFVRDDLETFRGPHGIAILPNGSKAYVTNFGGRNRGRFVSVIDLTTNTVITEIEVRLGPQGIAASLDSTKVYVANRFDDSITIIDAVRDEVLRRVGVGTQPFDVIVTGNGDEAYVSGNPFSVIAINPGLNSDVISPLPQLSGGFFGITQDAASVFLSVPPNVVETRDVGTGALQEMVTRAWRCRGYAAIGISST